MLIVTENHPNGQFLLKTIAESPRETSSFPRELKLDLTLLEVKELFALMAGILVFPHSLNQTDVTSPKASIGLDNAIRRTLGADAPKLSVDRDDQFSAQSQTSLIIADYRPSSHPRQPNGKGRNVLVQVLDSAVWKGKLFTLDRVEFAVNTSVFERNFDNSVKFRAAVGLLLAGDWNSSTLLIERIESNQEDESIVSELCAAIGVEIKFLSRSDLEEMLNNEH